MAEHPSRNSKTLESSNSSNSIPEQPGFGSLEPSQPEPSYVKLAMRNMVRKSGTSIKHFALTTLGLVALLVGLAYLTH
jgi:hypothetical protein